MTSNSVDIFHPIASNATAKADKKIWTGLFGSSTTVAIQRLAQQQQKLLLVICKDTPTAIKLNDELQSIAHEQTVHLFPDWETLPYDTFSPHQDIISQRLTTLYQLSRMQQGIVIVPVNTLLQRLAPKQFIEQNSLLISQGDRKNLHQLRQELEQSGYRCVDQVMTPGEFSVRGALLDLYPMGSQLPYRLDFFDDEIDEIRTFDPDNQRSIDKVSTIELLPAHEFPTDQAAINLFRSQYREKLTITTDKESIYHQVSQGILPAGIEYYLPLFFEQTDTLFDYLPENSQLIITEELEPAIDHYWHDIQFRYEDRRYDPNRPLLAPQELFLTKDALFSALKQTQRVVIDQHQKADSEKSQVIDYHTQPLPDLTINHQLKKPFAKLTDFLSLYENFTIVFCAESQGRREALLELLQQVDIKPKEIQQFDQVSDATARFVIHVNELTTGFIAPSQSLIVIPEDALHGNHIRQNRRRQKTADNNTEAIFKNLAELTPGQPVVHIDHGIGRYQGLQTIENAGIATEFLVLSYANDAKLYVPVANLHLISRYSGSDTDHAPLHKLGTDTWSKAKKKAAEKVRDVAAELLDIYAKRENSSGYKFHVDPQDYRAFCDSFPFEETDDQLQAIGAVKGDMMSTKTMDRLICGDVGFGKTEVAMRAAFIAVNDSKQVAVLVPTTLLAQQHYENFRDRFANWPVTIEVLSRFKTAKEQKIILEKVAAGQIDILIGTHKLLQNQVVYKDLGLLIVDEEHRFGVKQKESIKKLRANVDILTLTATPIPRTLNMAMGGMRDLSIIATPPAKRLAVKTFVRQRDEALIREAVLREILRGGQVYFLHNNVETIEKTARELTELLPEAKITTAHGQMRERDLERIMSDFYHQRFNVLVCTTIIETGIDVPSANTIIIDRADHLGLAQLHQLRGRVGRSHHQAYAYLLTPHEKRMTKDAIKRLEAIASLEDLGAGFTLATHDLEIRGAGELLGEEQSGQMNQVGFSLYMEMLDHAIKSLKDGKTPSLTDVVAKQTEIELHIPALLPDDYIHDVSVRLSLYKRIASCNNNNELDDIQVELIDRFGLLPQAAKNLIHVAKLKLKAQSLGIARIDANQSGGVIEFNDNTPVDPVNIIMLVQSQPNKFKIDGGNKLKFNQETTDAAQRFVAIETILSQLH
jgi:transcription-repair coupling factor (superfamily II helicase)